MPPHEADVSLMQTLVLLRDQLADAYPTENERINVIQFAGLQQGAIALGGEARTAWSNAIRYLQRLGKLETLASYLALDGNENLVRLVHAVAARSDQVSEAPTIASSAWRGPEAGSELEKIMGARSSLVDVSYFEKGLDRARSVARVDTDKGSGTGFVVAGNRLVTNHHILPTKERAEAAVLLFNFQRTAGGLNAPFEEMKLDPCAGFVTSCEDDWTVVAIAGDAVGRWGAIPLSDAPPTPGLCVNIIQHPGGGQKQISMTANPVVFVGGGRVQYLTDTLPGSSGSPVFDSSWELVALHHSGGWLTEPHAPTKTTYYRNEGIAVELFRTALN